MKTKTICCLAAAALLLVLLVLLRTAVPLRSAPETPPEPVRSAAPTPDPVETLLAGMSTEEKVWQLLILRPGQLVADDARTDAAAWAEALARCPAGGLVLDGGDIPSGQQLRDTLAAAAAAGAVTPFLCVDEEGGAVARVAYALGETTEFRPMYTYRALGPDTARRNAAVIAADIGGYGFNVDLAPVADVWTNPENRVIGTRAYSDDPAEAAKLVAAAVQGFHDGGVAAVLKHFPGHGDTAQDSHFGAACCDKTVAELEACEFLPFAAGIAAGADMVMVGHVTLTQVDPDAPATLSHAVVTGLLREQLGFDGVVLTDAMEMSALDGYSAGAAAARAILAGCDLILASSDPAAAAAAIAAQVPEARLDDSVRRVLRLKLARGLLHPCADPRLY